MHRIAHLNKSSFVNALSAVTAEPQSFVFVKSNKVKFIFISKCSFKKITKLKVVLGNP